MLSNQIFRYYALHINYETNQIAFEGDNVLDLTPSLGIPAWAIILIIIGGLALVGGAIACYVVKRRKTLQGELNLYNQIGK